MSRNSRESELWEKIRDLDARFPDGDFSYKPFTSFASRTQWWPRRQRYLHNIYKTGIVPRRPVESLVPERPVQIMPEGLTPTFPGKPGGCAEIPDEILYGPRRRRGRPRNDALREQATALQCSPRHARRLLQTRQSRARDRATYPQDVAEALAARNQRAVFVRELEEEDIVEDIAFMLAGMKRGGITAACKPAPQWDLARTLVQCHGIEKAVMLIHVTGGAAGVRYAASLLRVSRGSLYRKFAGRLDELRRRGREIEASLKTNPKMNLARLANRRPPKRRAVADDDNAWDELVDSRAYGTRNGRSLTRE